MTGPTAQRKGGNRFRWARNHLQLDKPLKWRKAYGPVPKHTFLKDHKATFGIIFFFFYVCFHLDLCEDGSTNPPGGGLRFICFSTSFCSSFSFSASSSISRTRALIASSSWDTKKNNNESQLPIMKCHWHRLYRPFTMKKCCPTCQYHYQIFSLKRRKGFSFSSTLSDVLCEGFICICIPNYF